MGRTSHSTNRRRRAIGALIIGALTLTACGGDDDSSDDSAAEEPAAEPTSEEPAADGGLAIGGGDTAADDEAGGGSSGDVSFDLGQIGRDVIIELRVVVSSDDIQRSVAAVSARAATLGGGVASSDVDYGNPARGERGYAVLVVKVPPAEVDALLAGIEQTGTIQSLDQSAQDVTEQLVDLDVRIANARESVENVRGFMERAEDLTDLVALESELTRRQTELERLEAQQRNLSERVAFSTVTIEIVPTESVPEPPDEADDTIGDAFRKGWDGFTGAVWGIAYVLAVLAPFLALAAVVGLVAVLVLRHRRRTAEPGPSVISSASGPPPGPQPEEST
jgi:hypothetical protein